MDPQVMNSIAAAFEKLKIDWYDGRSSDSLLRALNTVTVYKDAFPSRRKKAFHARSRLLIPDLAMYGIDDQISSLDIPRGMALMIFAEKRHILREGGQFYHDASIASLPAREDNRASSLVVLPRIGQPYVYDEVGFLGEEFRLFRGDYVLSDLLGFGGATIRSLRVPPGWTVTLDAAGLDGDGLTFQPGGVWNIGRILPELGNGVTKVKVRMDDDSSDFRTPRPVLFSEYSPSGSNFDGPAQELDLGRYSLRDHSLLLAEDHLRSAYVPRGFKLTFFGNQYFEGTGIPESEPGWFTVANLEFPVRSVIVEEIED